MSVQRIRLEVAEALNQFAYVEAHATSQGEVYVQTALQTSVGNTFFASIYFDNYPNSMPNVFITTPAIRSTAPHKYSENRICYLHPNMWNPGRHNLTFVIARIAKWLNKYEVWKVTGEWPGAEVKH